MSFGGGSGGAGALQTDSDVALSNPADGQVLEYSSTLQKWQNQTPVNASNATTSVPGLVQLAGDLAGNAASPSVARVNGIAVTGTPSANQVLTASSSTAAAWATPVSGVTLDTTAADIRPLGSQSAGLVGKAADAGHVHAMPRLDQVASPTADVALGTQKITGLADGSAATDAAAFGQIPVAGNGAGTYAAGNDSRITGAATSSALSAEATRATGAETALTAYQKTDVATTVMTAGAVVVGKHNPVDATTGTMAMTLANGTSAGQVVSLEKTDSSVNTVTLTGNIRGTTGTVTLYWQYETLDLIAKADGSWWPDAGHKTKSSLDAAYVGAGTQNVLLPASNGSDDTAAVNAAIAASPANATIVGRSGTTYIAGSGPFLFIGNRTYSMYGVTMRPKNGGNYDAVVASPAALTTGAGNNYDAPIHIRGLNVNGNVANQTSGQGYGVLLGSGSNVTTALGSTWFVDVIVRDTRGTGICLTEINLDGSGLVAGAPAPYTGEARFINCRVYNAGAQGIWQRGGGLGGAAAMTDGFCQNCIVGYTTHDGIRIDSSGGWDISGNHPYGTGLAGILVQGSFSTRITGNYIEGIGVLDNAAAHQSVSTAFTQAPAWDTSTSFVFNQVVTYNGLIYKSKIDGNAGNQPDTSTAQWGAYAGGITVGAITALASNSARPLHVIANEISFGHNSWSLNSAFTYVALWVQGPSSGTSKATAFILGNDFANELQPAGTNTIALKLSGAGAGPSGVNPYERDNAVRGAWSASRSAGTTCAPVAAVGANAAGGTGASATVTGNNQAGNLSVTTGNSGIVAGSLVSVSYTGTPAPTPRITISPRNAATAALGPFYLSTSTTGFTINGSVVPANSTTYNFDYVAMMGA